MTDANALITTSLPTTRSHSMCRRLNSYGYIHNCPGRKVPSPAKQLETLLNLKENVYLPLKGNILRLMKKHMDMKLKGTKQVDNLRNVENELKERYPEIFATEESEKRMYFATRLVLSAHALRRGQLNLNEKRQAAVTSPIITHNEKENHQDLAPETNQRLKLRSANHGTPRTISLSQWKQFRVGFEQKDHGMPESASSLSRSNESLKPNITCTVHDPNQYRDIHSFLESSVPPMTHLMDAFIDFGCINAEFLLTISSWSFEMIREVLDQLSLGPNGRQITEMEKFILENHFKEYFTRGNSNL